jgi:hypothetical protein
MILALVTLAAAWTGHNPEGTEGARVRWVGEHVDLYGEALARAGGDPAATYDLPVYSGGTTDEGYHSYLPMETWAELEWTGTRTIDLQSFANLPDVSWSLGDWALGNELCPLADAPEGSFTQAYCHRFAGAMGALNSSHFPPQSESAHAWYHRLALDAAARCVTLREELGAPGAGERGELVEEALRTCELEALALEGVGHHYLQDAWSSGHTWERWGSPRLSDWIATSEFVPDAATLYAVVVGSFAGIIHGHESITGIADPMCSENPNVWIIPPGGGEAEAFLAVGDHEYERGNLTPTQTAGLAACTDASLGDVIAALGDAEVLDLEANATGFDRTACFGNRASNLAFYTGLFETGPFSGQEVELALRWAGRLTLVAADAIAPELGAIVAAMSDTFRREAVVVMVTANAARWTGGDDAWGTDLASLEVARDDGTPQALTFFGATRNREWVGEMETVGIEVFDPFYEAIAGEATAPDDMRADMAEGLRWTFGPGHPDYWCETFDADLDDERSDLRVLVDACQAGGEFATAACDACTARVVHYLRDGESAEDYDQSDEPLCADFAPDTTFVYADLDEASSTPRADAAEAICEGGSIWVATDAAVYRVKTNVALGGAAASAKEIAVLGVPPVYGTAYGERFFYSGTDGALYQVDAALFDQPFGVGECTGASGMDVDTKDEVLFVACHDDHTVASFDLASSPPTFIEAVYLPSLPGIPEEPTDVAAHPEGGIVAVSTEYLYGSRDGVTLLAVSNGAFGASNHVAISGRYKFSSSQGVDYSSNVRLWVSNFSYLECPGGSSSSCTGDPEYWVNSVSFTDVADAAVDRQFTVDGRTTAVQSLWDDRAIIAGFTTMNAYVVSWNSSSAPDAEVYIGEDRPDSFAPVPDAGRIFVGFANSGATCGLGIIDAADADPNFWTYLGTDSSLVDCVRVVVTAD